MTDIFEGQPQFDMREKHAVKLRDAALRKMADILDKSGLDIDDFIDYYDSERPSVSDQIQAHRRKLAHIRNFQENTQKMRAALEEKRGKQAEAKRSTREGTEGNQKAGAGETKAPEERKQAATARDGFVKATNSGQQQPI